MSNMLLSHFYLQLNGLCNVSNDLNQPFSNQCLSIIIIKPKMDGISPFDVWFLLY